MPTADSLATETVIEKAQRIPRTVTAYQLKSIVGRLFALPPAHLRLVWETEEWDPVGRKLAVDDDERWSVSSDEEEEAEEGRGFGQGGLANAGDGQAGFVQTAGGAEVTKENVEREKGKWVQREVELVDGTRQVGFWIEGKSARVRVEVREQTW